jgi:hypothetical protein
MALAFPLFNPSHRSYRIFYSFAAMLLLAFSSSPSFAEPELELFSTNLYETIYTPDGSGRYLAPPKSGVKFTARFYKAVYP